jgi:hypothetical protein
VEVHDCLYKDADRHCFCRLLSFALEVELTGDRPWQQKDPCKER